MSTEFEFKVATPAQMLAHLRDCPDHELGGNLTQAYYHAGRDHVAWGKNTQSDIERLFQPQLERHTALLSGNPDADYRKWVQITNEQLEKGIQDGQASMPIEDRELPLNPLIAADFPRKKGARLEPSPGLTQIFMDRLIADKVKFNIRTKTVHMNDTQLVTPESDVINFRKEHGWAPVNNFDKWVYGFARKQEFDPVRDYLDSLELMDVDGEEFEYYNNNLLELLLNVPKNANTLIYEKFIQMWLVGAVMRAHVPGAKFDSTLVLIGPRGYRKSSFYGALASGFLNLGHNAEEAERAKWSYDVNCSLIGSGNDKDTLSLCHKYWVVVLDEVDQLSTKDSGRIKNFIQKQEDDWRVPYGRISEIFPRRFVFGATTNHTEFLSDPDPDRRWLPIVVDRPVPTEEILLHRDNIWRWAKTAYLKRTRNPYMDQLEMAAHSQLYAQHTIENDFDLAVEAFRDLVLSEAYVGNGEEAAVVFTLKEIYDIFEASGKWPKKELRDTLSRKGFYINRQLKRENFNYGRKVWHRDQNDTKVVPHAGQVDGVRSSIGLNAI